ncbi:hypothetical protein I6H07_13280 [Hafnia alvei]|uniref:hypothetical protein n=1 Tax=Hafnia alvei TaxID=569 RepID=UPI000B675911|nr:hypothetical protein [Hafnia alvei]MBI0276748.1 hypothetical protein [Hafnia alvei]PNK99797.1 hypothetical protein CEQ28_020505 [Hafnia alvei]
MPDKNNCQNKQPRPHGQSSRKKKAKKALHRAKMKESASNGTSQPTAAVQKNSANLNGHFVGMMMPGKDHPYPYRLFRVQSGVKGNLFAGQSVKIYANSDEIAQVMRDTPALRAVIITGVTRPNKKSSNFAAADGFSVSDAPAPKVYLRKGVNTASGGRYASEWGYVK